VGAWPALPAPAAATAWEAHRRLRAALASLLTGIDLDGCIDPATKKVLPWAKAIIKRFNTYAEYSPSGTGVKSCVVLLGHHQTIIRKARSSSTITASGSGTANIYINGSSVGSVTVYLDWMTGGGNIATSKDLFVQYFHDQDKWIVVGAACA
jgi:hypothetical protein